jgi:hypothetical protein
MGNGWEEFNPKAYYLIPIPYPLSEVNTIKNSQEAVFL